MSASIDKRVCIVHLILKRKSDGEPKEQKLKSVRKRRVTGKVTTRRQSPGNGEVSSQSAAVTRPSDVKLICVCTHNAISGGAVLIPYGGLSTLRDSSRGRVVARSHRISQRAAGSIFCTVLYRYSTCEPPSQYLSVHR